MNRDSLQDALSHISDKHIAEAASAKKRRYAPWIGAVAACLVVAIGLGIVLPRLPDRNPGNSTVRQPLFTTPNAPNAPSAPNAPEIFVPAQISIVPLAAAQHPETVLFPLDQSDFDAWSEEYQKWRLNTQELHKAPEGYADSLAGFWKQSTQTFLNSDNGENTLYSPISLYMALSILAQATEGETRQEILTLLGADNMDALCQQAKLVFENQYWNDGVHTSILANSLWLDNAFAFRQDTINTIAEQFYASVYQGELESPEMNIALKDWLSKQTGGLLDDSIANLDPMDISTALAIASTINYRCKWTSAFSETKNTQDLFHGAAGDQTVTYMNKTILYGDYYWDEGYQATHLSLDDGSRMWLILPNEDTSAQAILESGKATDLIFGDETTAGYTSLRVNLSVPKFDISTDLNMMEGLQKLGIQKVMDEEQADFSSISADPDSHIWVDRVQQGVRVAIDEEGLTGVAYTLIVAPGDGAMFATEEVDFVLDRPFLFVVESSDGLPLFTGIVNQISNSSTKEPETGNESQNNTLQPENTDNDVPSGSDEDTEEPAVQTVKVFDTDNITGITFYSYYGSGIGSDVSAQHLEEIISWLDSFTTAEKIPDGVPVPPGTNTVFVEIVYADGRIVKKGIDTTTVDGIVYNIEGNNAPECYWDILSRTSLE